MNQGTIMLSSSSKVLFVISIGICILFGGCDKPISPISENVSDSGRQDDGSFELAIQTNSIGMEFVWIPPGEFMMGSSMSIEETYARYGSFPAESFKNEHPRHKVRLTKGFWMSRYEVTQAQYEAVMGKNPSRTKEWDNSSMYPVDSMSWQDAMDFCEALSIKEGRRYTLPTEAQWEYACRARTTTEFFWGDDAEQLEKYAWYDIDDAYEPEDRISPVGQKLPNPWGLYDMCGNVAEWCLDWYDPDYYANSPGVDPYNETPVEEAFLKDLKVLRGGSFVHPAVLCRSASRGLDLYYASDPASGFRVICWDLQEANN